MYRIDIKGDFRGVNVNVKELEDYLQELLQDATGEEAARVIRHLSEAQSADDVFYELNRLNRQ
jgi:flagellar motor switch protein FliG